MGSKVKRGRGGVPKCNGVTKDGPMACTVYGRTVLISECKACPYQIKKCKRGYDIARTFPGVPAGRSPEFALVAPPAANAAREGLLVSPRYRPGPKTATEFVSSADELRNAVERLYDDPQGSKEVRTMERMPQLDKSDSDGAKVIKHALFYVVPGNANMGVAKTAKELKRWLEQRMEGSDPVRVIRGKELEIRMEVKTRVTLSTLRQKKKGK